MKPAYLAAVLFFLVVGGPIDLLGVSATAQNITCTVGTVNYPPVQNLNMTRLHMKRWYIQEIFPFESGHLTDPPSIDCYSQLILLYDPPNPPFTHQFLEIYTNVIDNSTDVLAMTGAPLVMNSSAVWLIMSNTAIPIYTTVFTHTDYETYGVMHFCPYLGGPGYYEQVLTFTGVPDPEEGLVVELKGKVASLGFPTEHGVRVPHHADCNYWDYEYYADDDADGGGGGGGMNSKVDTDFEA